MLKLNPNQMLVASVLSIAALSFIASFVFFLSNKDPEINSIQYTEVSKIIHQKKNPNLNTFIRMTTEDKKITESEFVEIKELAQTTKDPETAEQIIHEILQESKDQTKDKLSDPKVKQDAKANPTTPVKQELKNIPTA